MGRLIDADKLLETLQDLEPHCENKDYEYGMLNTMRYYMTKIINDEPTAFDTDKVVEQLDKASDYYEFDEQGMEHVQMLRLVDAIEIVKGGGADAEH